MANIKPLDQSTDKWVRRAQVAGPDYEAGVRNPRTPWVEATFAAEGNYKAGVITAANAGKFGRGVKLAGEDKWKTGAVQKGPGRFAEGVAISKDAWRDGFAPFQSVIAGIKLPPRGPKGSPQNLQRVAVIATSLRTLAEKGGV